MPKEPVFNFEFFDPNIPQDHEAYARLCNQLIKHNIFGIAEAHNAKGPQNFVLGILPSLKKGIVFREGIYYEAQHLIDSFLNDPSKVEISPFLRKLLSWGAYENNKVEILYECKKTGAHLIGIDTHFSYRSQAFIDESTNYPTLRMKAMNAYAIEIIRHVIGREKMTSEQQCIISAGAAHLKAIKNSNVPGMCTILKIPTVNIVDISDETMSPNQFYIVQESQFPDFDAHLQHVLKARCLDDRTLDTLDFYKANNDDELLKLSFIPSFIRYDIQIEAIPLANFKLSETPSKKLVS